ncbi:MAG: iron-containing alcohol dehydrogenase, partial [Prevotella sp.]|nr:iron-containing alcohol dehydrogenase [Prevotella sp.]
MKDFIYYAPTEVVFGEDSEKQVASLVKKYGGKRVLVHYGGQSAKKSGLLDNIFGLLNEGGIEFFELGGVVPNPRLSKVREGIALCREQKIDFILAVGGGSVIDSAGKVNVNGADKILFTSIPYDESWNVYVDGEYVP